MNGPPRFFFGQRKKANNFIENADSVIQGELYFECTEKKFGVPKQIVSFVLPLGATINMNGTALYQGVSTVFIAQVYGMDLTLIQQLTIVLTAVLASIGTAGAPASGVITLAIVLKSIGVPLEGIALIMGVERILDMCRSVVNVTGDAACAVVVASSEGEESSQIIS